MLLLLLLLLFPSCCGAFGLFSNDLIDPEGMNSVVGRHCKELADMIYNERESRSQTRIYAQRLELEVEKLMNTVSNMKESFQTLLYDHLELKRNVDEMGTNGLHPSVFDLNSNPRSSEMVNELKWIHHNIGLLFNKNADNKHEFEALYNLTLLSQEKVNKIEENVRTNLLNHEKRSEEALESVQKGLIKYTDGKILTLTLIQGAMVTDVNVLREQKRNKSDIVSLTACGGQVYKGRVVFSDIRTAYGVNNVDSFTSSGQFTCEIQGLYLFIFTISANSSNAAYEIVKNGNKFTEVHIDKENTGTSNTIHNSGTGITVASLNVNDTIGVRTSRITELSHPDFKHDSCFTVVKIN